MKYFPFFLQLNKLPCLVVGGGSVAERKLDLLIKANADITVISPDFSEYILEFKSKNNKLLEKIENISLLNNNLVNEQIENKKILKFKKKNFYKKKFFKKKAK